MPRGLRRRKAIETIPTHHAPMAMKTRLILKGPKDIYAEPVDNPRIADNAGQLQWSNAGLRQKVDSDAGGPNINIQTTIQKIQAYKPPEYVSPYGEPRKVISETSKTRTSVVRTRPPGRSSQGIPPWRCCFAQRGIPEWDRHVDISIPGTFRICIALSCQHQKCKDCLWETSELPDHPQTRLRADSKLDETEDSSLSPPEMHEDAPDEENQTVAEKRSMAPPSMGGINRDPRTGRARLWTKK
ncbi:uncharacterized protein RAG0_09485 [Rhynchosporium agropyri]|uniref:Uncharacterized protein n=1 Tax=Rhynchosporium agropyri TaxID=914238 RepID=A0A1E1KVP8_9HELO|nr:uncharacterized protein RAG0_09485 [Rhynchosporium agropyri]